MEQENKNSFYQIENKEANNKKLFNDDSKQKRQISSSLPSHILEF